MGRPIFWFTVTPLEEAEEGTDRWAVEHNWVSITPLRLDLTDEKDLARALSLAQTPPVSPAKKRVTVFLKDRSCERRALRFRGACWRNGWWRAPGGQNARARIRRRGDTRRSLSRRSRW